MRALWSRVAGIVPDARDRFAFRRFWGDGLFSAGAFFVIDSYENVRLKNEFRWAELSGGDQSAEGSSAAAIIDGAFAPQATAMLTALFARHASGRLRVTSDAERPPADATLICYGPADSNAKTFEVEAGSGTSLCRLVLNSRAERSFRVADRLFSIETRDGVTYDKAVVLRFANDESIGCSSSHVICAGLSEWGNLAAVPLSHRPLEASPEALRSLSLGGAAISASCWKSPAATLSKPWAKSSPRFFGMWSRANVKIWRPHP